MDKKLNPICNNCTNLNKTCKGTCNMVWTGCIYKNKDSEKSSK